MPKDRRTLRIRTIALAGLSAAMLLEGAGCSLLPARKVPPEPAYGGPPTEAPSAVGFGSQAPPSVGYGNGAPGTSMPPLGSYGPNGMAGAGNYGSGLPETNPALSGGMPGASDPLVNPALGMPGSMPGAMAPAGYSPTMPSAGGMPPSGYDAPAGGYSSPMLQNSAQPQSPYNMGTPGAPPAPL